ncbi:HAAS signaling domain-containing protein [Saccharopolyspora tripterygii]
MMTLDKYTDDLHRALRFHEISGDRTGEVLAEVEAHVAETGEDPVDAFGKPRDYARQVAAQLDPSTGKRSTGGIVVSFIVIATLALFGQSFFGDGLALDEAGVVYTMRDVVSKPLLLVAVIGVALLVYLARTASENNKLYGGGAVLALIAGLGAQVLCNNNLDDATPVITAPSRLILALGVVFLIGMFAMLAHSIRRGRVRYPKKN